ncbi:MAG: SPOR domain-containing protein [Alphaproteobacteria bacterium]|nr:SPOR domain-containing protein [Alphaproteobacteria bacterium]
MENQEDNLDLLDLGEENENVDTLPEVEPFSAPRPKRPWLLMGIGFATIILATLIIVAKLGGDSGSSTSVDLDAPVSAEVKPAEKPVEDLKVPEKAPVVEKVEKEQPAPKPAPVAKPVETDGTPIRVVEDRKEVVFNPDKPAPQKPAVKSEPKKISAPAPVKKATAPVAAATGSIYVQFGSYTSRALAQSAEQKIRKAHSALFSGKQFVILAAQVKGQTTYRLRVPFHSANDANGFCRNAKSDGLDCYVTK